MTVLPHAAPRALLWRDHQAICRLGSRTHTQPCDFSPVKVGSTLSTLRSSGSRMAGKWPILRHLRRCDRHSIPDQTDLPRTSRSIPEELLAQSLNQAPIPASPVLMLLGDQDDNLPLTKVESYLAYARAAGAPAPIQTVIYSGAYHAWTVPDLPTARFYPDLVSTKKCPLI